MRVDHGPYVDYPTWSLSPGFGESITLNLAPHNSTVFVQGQFDGEVKHLLGPILWDSKAAEFPLPNDMNVIRIVAAESDGSRWISKWTKP
ncbi:MAG: hypothetical protein H6747_15490 [Deltaproteobacteria bacterium]|nr:hypothetical protein [Deltaproteobacteria bacterium]